MYRKITLLFALLCLGYVSDVHAQCPPNIDFELGTYANWLYYTGTCCPGGVINTPTLSGAVVGRHTLTSGLGVDAYGGFPVVAPGSGTYSIKLGANASLYLAERIKYNVHVPSTPGIWSLIYRYAVVLDDPGHAISVQPRMTVTAYDSITNGTIPCTSYTYVALGGAIPGFLTSALPGSSGNPVFYKSWTMGNMKFPGYGGRTVVVDVAAGDCGLGGHWGYGYWDMTCGFFANQIIGCASGTVTLAGPDGYSGYHWYDSLTFTTSYGTSQIVTIAAPTVTTTYAVILTPYPGYGCTDTLYTQVVPSTITVSPSHDTAICAGASVTLSSGATSTALPLTYVWTPATGLSCTTCSNPVATPTTTTVYSVTVTDALSCTKTAAITITVNPNPAPIGGPSTVCPGQNVTETDAVGGGVWTCAPTTVGTIAPFSGVLTGITSGTVSVVYSIGGICSVSRIVTVNTAPLPITPASPHVCIGQTITLSDATPGGGTWSDVCCTAFATVGSTTGIVTGISAGTATVTFTSTTTGCTITKVVTVDATPMPITGLSSICNGTCTTLFDGTPGGTWSHLGTHVTIGSSSGVVCGVSVGVDTVKYTAPTGCTVTFSMTVAPTPGPITGPTSLCISGPGSSITLADTSAGGIWSSGNLSIADIGSVTGVVTPTFFPGVDTIYYTIGSCSSTYVITVDPLPGPITGLTPLCAGDSTLYSAPGGITWSSTNPAIATVGSTSGIVRGVSGGVDSIYVTSAVGCRAGALLVVNSLPAPITGSTTICVGTTTLLADATVPGTFSTAPGTWATVTPTGLVTGILVGAEVITYTALSTGCKRYTTVNVGSTPAPIGGTLTVCVGSTTGLTDAVGPGTWSVSTPAIGTISSSGIFRGIAAGTDTVTYSIGAGCNAKAVVTVNPLPPAIVPTAPQLCVGGVLPLTDPLGPGTWLASCPGTLLIGTSSGIVTGVGTGACTVTYTLSSTGCQTTRSVTVNPNPPAITPPSPAVCVGSTLPLSDPLGGGTWSSTVPTIGSVNPLSGVVTGINPGITTIKYTLPTTCWTSTVVTVNPLPTLFTVGGSGSFCAGGIGLPVVLGGSTPGVLYQLLLGGIPIDTLVGTGGILNYGLQTVGGTYTVVAIDPVTGCSRPMTGSAVIVVNPLPATIVGPSAVCVANTIILTDATPIGTWYSSNPAAATCTLGPSTSTTVTGITNYLTTVITYSLTGTGCTATHTVTVQPSPGPIMGLSSVCVGYNITLSDTVLGGGWTSSDTTKATVGLSTGIVHGVAAGTVTITYSLGSGCTRTTTITITPAPNPITGSHAVCSGMCDTLHDTTPLGSWLLDPSSTGLGTITPVTGIFCTTPGATGVAIISYAASGGTGCAVSTTVTINPIPLPIGGTLQVCQGSTTNLSDLTPGGLFSVTPTTVATIVPGTGVLTGIITGSSTPATATVTYTAVGCPITAIVTVNPLPTAITGVTHVCQGATVTLSSTPGTGTWTATPSTLVTVTPGPGSTTIVTGGSSSVGIATVTYTLPTGCSRSTPVTVNLSPAPIIGPANVCLGHTVVLTDATPGGTWSSSNTLIATVGSTGVVTPGSTPGVVTISYTVGGCAATLLFTVASPPLPIVGPASVCVAGACVTYTDPTSGGTWSSANPTIATINPTTGMLCGLSSGTVIISYGSSPSCPSVMPVIVNPVSPILGTLTVCQGQSTHLIDTSLGGTWSSSNTSVGTINTAGVVTGVGAGTTIINYTLPTGCVASVTVTVNPQPAPIGGPGTVCVGQMMVQTDAIPLGTWSVSNAAVGTIGATTGIFGGISPGLDTVFYTLTSTGCNISRVVTVNPNPPAIVGPSIVCLGATMTLSDVPGGTWSSSNPAIGSIGSSTGIVTGLAYGTTTIAYVMPGSSCSVTKVVTVSAAPPPPTGDTSLCQYQVGLLTDASGSGTWSSSNHAVATIDSVTGVISGWAAGTSIVSFSVSPGCASAVTVTVHPLPAAIGGPSDVCVGSTITLTDATGGGSWNSSMPSAATVGVTSGIVTGVAPGATIITYRLATGCSTTKFVNVSVGPAPIIGVSMICLGSSTTVFDATLGGTWYSSNPAVATIDPFGNVTAVSVGTTIISYMVSGSACAATLPMAVNPRAGAITGSMNICQGATETLGNSISGGIWTSSSPVIATIDSFSGLLTAMVGFPVPVPVVITYTLGAGCDTTAIVIVNPLPAAISGPGAVCQGQTITLFDATTPGVWSATPLTVGTVDALGDVTGMSAGIVTVSYTNSYGCAATFPVTVNIAPGPITGNFNVCLGGTSALHDSIPGGTWIAVPTSVGTISTAGVVTGISLGTLSVFYTLAGGCAASATLHVYPLPVQYTVTGGGNFCAGGTGVHVYLSNSDVGVNYMVYNGPTAVGAYPGTGSSIDFGLFTVAGTYTVIGTNTATGCSSNMISSAVVYVIPAVTPSVTLSASPNDTVCAGTSVTFNPVIVNGGTPTYVWSVNSVPVALTGTYTFVPADHDTVRLMITSTATCATPTTATGTLIMKVNPFMHPTVSLDVINPNDTVCKGTVVDVNANTGYGGTAPFYEWWRNAAPVTGVTGPVYSFVPNNGDQVSVIMHSNYPCRLANADTSTPVNLTVEDPAWVVVTITGNTTVGHHLNDTLVATATNAVNPTYQWFVNGVPVASATTDTFIYNSFSYPNEDSVSCRVTSNGVCVIQSHQWVYIQVTAVGVANVTQGGDISVLPNPNKGEFMVKGTLGSVTDDEVSLEMTDMLGQIVYSNKVRVANGKLNERVTLKQSLANGMYILSVKSGTENRMFHIVVEQ